jgi:hypothetical protein
MRSGAVIIVALACIALAGLAAAAATGDRAQAFTLGVARSTATELKPRKTVCQTPVTVPGDAAFDGVTLAIGTERRPGPRLDVVVREVAADDPSARTGAALARGSLAGGYPDVDRAPEHTVWFERVPAERTVAVCFENRGTRSAFIYGDADAASRSTTALVEGEPAGADLALEFERRDPRSLASLIPAMLDRAALFRAQWLGAWTYWLLGALVVLAVPALLVGALRAAMRDTA